ncbi:ABC transporter substrate-binding protein [Paenibacillus apii]|uniref:ABC transporter substrate-binding protein n=1 Tax=Paenibacillus apii TaxID=1850370 RepID=UPI00143B9FAB|nr:ABC transporter substrate-binding protein [Paenibacillus apii]NJJ41135.1 carbohydrate ABC transporter substrate-binding protein [Paenibacillus apii]
MKKRPVVLALSLMLMAATFTGCSVGGSHFAADTKEARTQSRPVILKMFTFGEGLSEQLHDMAEKYHALHPEVTVETELISSEYDSVLKTRLNSGDVPDIFMTQGYWANRTYKDLVVELTGELFVGQIEDSALKSAEWDGKIYGVPVSIQSYGFIYNKRVFEAAGISSLPSTYTGLEQAANRIKAIGVTPFANSFKEWWVFKHIATQALAAEEGDYEETAQDISQGKKTFKDLPLFGRTFDMIDLMVKYGNDQPLATDYGTGLALVAQGKAAMVHNGSWAEGDMLKADPSAELGFFPEPVGDDPSKARLMVDSSVLLRISDTSKHINEAKNFLNYIVTDYIKHYGWHGEVPVVKGGALPSGQLAADTIRYMKLGRTYPWVQSYWPDGFDTQLGALLQEYAAHAKSKDEVLEELTKAWVKLVKAENM